MAAAASEDENWEAIKAKTQEYLEAKFNAQVATAFADCCSQYDDLEEVKNDLELDDEDSWENSGIVQEIGDTAQLTDEKQKLLFHRLRVCMGLEEESAESLGVELLHELDLKLGVDDIKKARRYWATQCPTFSGANDQTMLKLIAIGLKNDVPLLSLLNDLYQIWRLEISVRENKNHVSENEWVNSSKYLSSLKDKEVKQLIIAGLRSYSRRVLPSPMLRTYQLVNDSLSEYIHIIANMAAMVSNLVKTNDENMQQSFPLQIDLWIIPRDAHSSNNSSMMMVGIGDESDDDDEEDEDDEDEKEDQSHMVDIGDIAELLKKDKIKFEKDGIEMNKAACVRKMRENLDKVVGNERSIRTVMILDRRDTKKEDKHYDLYTYKAPKPFGDISSDYLHEQMMHHTNAYLIAHPDDKPLGENETEINIKSDRRPIGGGFTASHREFCVSFHIHSTDNIAMYCWMHGFGVRFLPEHLVRVLPKYFKGNDLKENGIDEKWLAQRFKLKCTDHRFDGWHRKINASF